MPTEQSVGVYKMLVLNCPKMLEINCHFLLESTCRLQFAEQWWIWVAVNVFSVYMWWCNFMTGSDNMATLLMWVVYLGNAIIMLVKWEKEAKNHEI